MFNQVQIADDAVAKKQVKGRGHVIDDVNQRGRLHAGRLVAMQEFFEDYSLTAQTNVRSMLDALKFEIVRVGLNDVSASHLSTRSIWSSARCCEDWWGCLDEQISDVGWRILENLVVATPTEDTPMIFNDESGGPKSKKNSFR